MTGLLDEIELIKQNIKSYPGFPKPGIVFRDVFSVLSNPKSAEALQNVMLASCSNISDIQAVCALESRGFLFGPILALKLKVPFVPIRKKGKLPGKVNSVAYELEYGSDILEIQCDSLPPNTSVLLVDDLLATGESLKAGCRLIESVGSKVSHCLVIIELKELKGKEKVPCPVNSLIQL